MSVDVVPIERHQEFYREEMASACRTLRQAHRMRPLEVFVVGYGQDGELFVRGYPNDPKNAMWLMELAKDRLLHPNGSD